MTRIQIQTHSVHKGSTHEELQRRAKDIFEYGKIFDVNHHSCGICFEVKCEGMPIRYWVHISGFRVTEIIEEVTA
jgi:hypothetical protein